MNRRISMVLLLLVIAGAPLFTQTAATQPMAVDAGALPLPEPVFVDPSVQKAALSQGPAGFWLPDFEEVVYYLWNFGDVVSQPAFIVPDAVYAQAAVTDAAIPTSIRNNRYFIESVRLTNLAQRAFEDGDYDASKQYSDEAVRYAQLSDEYVQLQLKIRETDNAIAAARTRLEWATSTAVDAARRYPAEYSQAQSAYNEARSLRTRESWDESIAAANRVINALALVTEAPPVIAAPPPPPPPPPPPVVEVTPPVVVTPSVYQLPAQYTVRPWAVSKDCLWNIAGRPWAYGDPNQWRLLYNANKVKFPQPDNPDLIHPGMILDIPSIRGETREGMWDAGRNYVPLR